MCKWFDESDGRQGNEETRTGIPSTEFDNKVPMASGWPKMVGRAHSLAAAVPRGQRFASLVALRTSCSGVQRAAV